MRTLAHIFCLAFETLAEQYFQQNSARSQTTQPECPLDLIAHHAIGGQIFRLGRKNQKGVVIPSLIASDLLIMQLVSPDVDGVHPFPSFLRHGRRSNRMRGGSAVLHTLNL
jgi:hypothetical protein